MHKETSASDPEARKFTVAKAITVGQVCVNGGVFLVIGLTVVVCQIFHLLRWPEALILGAILAWPWWSVSVPRWRRWALARGVDAHKLQKAAVMTGLVWPKGWIFEKTEIPPGKRENN